MTDREKHISVLQNIDKAYRTFTQEEYRALEYAIASLKTDLKYDLIYEGEEIYTKADMVDMLEDLKQDIIAEAYGIEIDCTDYVVNVADIDKVIQQKINALRGNEND